MKIEVRLFANLADYAPPAGRDHATTVELPEGATVDELVQRLAIPEEIPRLMVVNGHDVPLGHRLRAGDVVSIFPPLAGG